MQADAGNLVKAALIRCRLPFASGGDSGSLAVSLHRGFHRPTGIDERTAIYIVLEVRRADALSGADSLARLIAVSLNGQPLPVMNSEPMSDSAGAPRPATLQLTFDISRLHEPFNDLQVVLSVSPHSVVSLDAACLEIHDSG